MMYNMVMAPRNRMVIDQLSGKGTRVWSCTFLVLERWENIACCRNCSYSYFT